MADEAKPSVFALADDVVRSAANGIVNGFGWLLTLGKVNDSMNYIAAAADTAADKVAMLFGATPVGKGNFADNLAAEKAATAQAEKESPVGSFIGDAIGEVATLFLGGGIIAKGIEWGAKCIALAKGAINLGKVTRAATVVEKTATMNNTADMSWSMVQAKDLGTPITRAASGATKTVEDEAAALSERWRLKGESTRPAADDAATAPQGPPVRRPDVKGFSVRQQTAINEAYESAPSHDIGMQRVVQLKGEIEKAPPLAWYARLGWPAALAGGGLFAAYEISEKGPKGFASMIPEGGWVDRQLSFSPGYNAMKSEFAAKGATLPEGAVSSALTGQPMKRSHEPGSP
jgi:hypothetical protein